MKTDRKCQLCGKNFKGDYRAKYCSQECIDENRRQRQAEYRLSKGVPPRDPSYKKRPHKSNVKMEPDRMKIEHMGHLTKTKERISYEDAIALSPSTATKNRIIQGKTIIFPRTQERFNELNAKK
jgi:hypothetical protein